MLDTLPKTIVSESKPSAFPSALRAKRSAVQTLTAEDKQTEAVTQHTCAKCGRKEMFYSAVQMRSADEGSTIFYRCVCGHKYGSLLILARLNTPCTGANHDRQIQRDSRQLKIENIFYSMARQIIRKPHRIFLFAKSIKQPLPAPAHTPFPRSSHTQPCQEPQGYCPSPLALGHS